MPRKKVQFGITKINYPKTLLSFAFKIMHEKRLLFTFAYRSFEDIDQVKLYAKNVIKKSKNDSWSDEDSHYVDSVLIIPLIYNRELQLKKEYWDNPTDIVNYFNRYSAYLNMLKSPEFHEILVTPAIENGQVNFNSAIPFKKGSDRDIDIYMGCSDMYVSPEAKNAAIYFIDKIYGYDLNTNEINDNPISISPKSTNTLST